MAVGHTLEVHDFLMIRTVVVHHEQHRNAMVRRSPKCARCHHEVAVILNAHAEPAVLTMRQRVKGGGNHVLSEYTVDDQGARYGDGPDAILLHPVIYQFCANWDSSKREVPANFDEMNKFCGVRLMFETETSDELRKLPADHVTNYDRVLAKLVARFGKPDKFSRRGKVIIETMEDDIAYREDRQNRAWRWCPASESGSQTTCTASVVLSLEPSTGVATVLYSTPQLWQFAYARENNGYKGDKLYRMLHASK